MPPIVRATLFACALALGACASTPPETPPPPATPQTAWIVAANGAAIGQAHFQEGPKGVMIRLEFGDRVLPPGWHGLHLHQVGDCSDFAAGFEAAGDHLGMNRRIQHGLMNEHGPEAGDLPNLFASPAGIYAAEFFAPRVTMGAARVGERLPLLDADGSALIIHAGQDDQRSQPIGNAGARIACAALRTTP